MFFLCFPGAVLCCPVHGGDDNARLLYPLVFFRFFVFDQVKEKGYAVVVVAEGAGEEILGQTGETDATG